MAMNYRRLGRTGLPVSVVGFGSCQFRLVPERQVIATLLRGFELGVNLVHTAPDYEGADDLVARAVRESGRDVIVCSQGYGPIAEFERLFEDVCAKLGKQALDLFGIACVDDREALGEDVWGPRGMVDFLLRKKADGRLRGIFCTTHGAPAYLRKLIRADVFDALMVAYNPLGFHLLSYQPTNGREWEDLSRTRDEIFPLARQRDVGLMIMKPLAGGLLCRGQAFPPRAAIAPQAARARDILRRILAIEGVSCVVPGTASVAEADENALAGHGSLSAPEPERAKLTSQVRALDTALCSRCGKCESSCSQGLPVSYLFRDAYLHLFPSETFEAADSQSYFRLHPACEAVCATCADQSCSCPSGLDIPERLTQAHDLMQGLKERGLASPPPDESASRPESGAAPWVRVVSRDVPPGPLNLGEEIDVCLALQNTGTHMWTVGDGPEGLRAALLVSVNGRLTRKISPRHPVQPKQRGHFAFALGPLPAGAHRIRFDLALAGARMKAFLGETSVVVQPSQPCISLTALVRRAARAAVRASRAALSPKRRSGAAGLPGPPRAMESPQCILEYDVAYRAHNLPPRIPAGTRCTLWLELENRGTTAWQRSPSTGRPIDVALYIDESLAASVKLPVKEVRPRERVVLHVVFCSPSACGTHELKVDLVEQNVASFAQRGVTPLVVGFETFESPPTVTSRLTERALEANYFFSAPSQMASGGRDGRTYPVFARSARGCRITDVEGREYVDYVMGWGCALLGHAHPRIQNAVRQALEGGGVLSLPHHLEMEVTDALCAAVPCAEMVLFGKNGSDVCTAAARLARVCTGRHKLLVCGYHGWQDWHVERWGFAASGVPDRPAPLVVPFAFNDLDGFLRLIQEHKGQVAGVMLEPAAPVEGLNGPVRDADPSFLRRVAEVTRQEGALLILDEIITGFRYPGGSVQKATGVVPDLTCLGKALSAGMPLSALVGRRHLFHAGAERIYFGPTFKGEVYSFAAAREALALYGEQDVPAHVWGFGERLRRGINERCRAAGVAAAVVGPPFRMVVSFEERDPTRVGLMRTLLQQGLLKAGVLTYRGFMLPSLAHDELALEQTLRAYEFALGLLGRALREDRIVERLEIPPIT
jgi:glutamate-1-semialdehyde aminotransferase/predicted aldo/keto reductase-like oxidoreductase